MTANTRAMPTLAALLLLAACGEPSSPYVLNARVAERMARDQPCNARASVEYLPNGARISMPDSALFTIGRADLSSCGRYAMASAIEAMLNSNITRVVIEPSGNIEAPYAALARQRANTLKGLFTKAAFVPYQPPVVVQFNSAATIGVWGVVLTVPSNS